VGNDLFGAFGRDFATADGRRAMVVAITARQWSALVEALGLKDEIAGVEKRLGVSFATDEGERALRAVGDTCPRARPAQPRRRSPPTDPDRGDRRAAEESRAESCPSLQECALSLARGP